MTEFAMTWTFDLSDTIRFEFQCEIGQLGQLEATITHILINAYPQTMENRLLDSDWISITLDVEEKARYAWIKSHLPFRRLPPSLEDWYPVSLLTAAPLLNNKQPRSQGFSLEIGISREKPWERGCLLFKSGSMPLLSPTLPRDPKGGGFNILGDPGASSGDDAIFSGERHFWRESLFQGLKTPLGTFPYQTSSKSVEIRPADWPEIYQQTRYNRWRKRHDNLVSILTFTDSLKNPGHAPGLTCTSK